MIAEFVARFPVQVALDDMTLDSLKRIIQEPEGSIVNQYKELFAMDSVALEVSDSAIHDIAEKALLSGTGARAAQEIFERKLADAMFEVPSMPDVEAVLLEGDAVSYRKKERIAA
jgi:ATP-dependent Clp protease ATP-binding subunit ClpX